MPTDVTILLYCLIIIIRYNKAAQQHRSGRLCFICERLAYRIVCKSLWSPKKKHVKIIGII